MINEIKPPNKFLPLGRKIFLAGSIEMGVAEHWQDKVIKFLKEKEDKYHDIDILNPRRDDWDSSWVQSIDNKEFREQVEWEIDGIDKSRIIFFYFDPNTKSPITLFELGKAMSGYNDIIVVCPDGYWRKGNVEVYCKKEHVLLFNTLEQGLSSLLYLLDVKLWKKC